MCKIRKLISLGVIFCVACCLMQAAFAKPVSSASQSLNRIVAIVNNDVITQQQLDHKYSVVRQQLKAADQPVPSSGILRRQVLEQMIDDLLQLQIAKKAHITATSAEITAVLQRIAKRNSQGLSEMYKVLQKQGWSVPAFRKEIEHEVIIQKLQSGEVASRISISQEEVDSFIRDNLKSQSVIPEYHLARILISLPATPSSDDITQAEQRANNIAMQLKHGASFSKLAMSQSNGPEALQGGDLGWLKLGELTPAVSDALRKMRIGQVSAPIREVNGYVIIKMLAKRTAPVGSKTQRQQVEEMLFQRQFQEDLQTFLSRLRGDAYVKIMQ